MTSKHKNGFWPVWGLCLLVLTGCLTAAGCNRGQVLADQFLPIPDRSWDLAHQPEITIHVKDRKGPYKVYVNLRHTDQYRFANIYLVIHQRRESAALAADSLSVGLLIPENVSKRVELILAEPDGRWTGKHSGNLYTSRQLVWDHHFFPDTGVYILSLEQNMRENPLKQVVAAGLRIERAGAQ